MRYLVTGGAGFIGSTLVNNLEKNNNEIVVVDNLSMGKRENLNSSPKITFFEKDVRNRDFVNKLFADKFKEIFNLSIYYFLMFISKSKHSCLPGFHR